jgi:hypothetical protein
MLTASQKLAEFALSLRNAAIQLRLEATEHDRNTPLVGWPEHDNHIKAEAQAMRDKAAALEAKIAAADEGRGNLLIDVADVRWLMTHQPLVDELVAANRVIYTPATLNPSLPTS